MSIEVNVPGWKGMLDCAKAYRSDATIRIADGKARIMEVDDTKTNLFYTEVECQGEGVLSVDIEKFSKALTAAGRDPVIDIDEGFVTIEGSAKVKVPLISRESNVNWPDKFKTPIAECDLSPSQIDPVLSYAQFCNQAIVRFTLGDTRMKVQVGVEPDMAEFTSLSTATGESDAVFSMGLIQTIVKLAKGTDAINVGGFGKNVPMIFSWNVDNGICKVLVAPYIDQDL